MRKEQMYPAVLLLALVLFTIIAPLLAFITWAYVITTPDGHRTTGRNRSEGILFPLVFVPVILTQLSVRLLRKGRFGKYFQADAETMNPIMGLSLILGTLSIGTLVVYLLLSGGNAPLPLTLSTLFPTLFFFILGLTAHATTLTKK
jgi:hypothetical protein